LPRNRTLIREPSAAEASLVLLVQRAWRQAEPGVKRAVVAALAEDDPKLLAGAKQALERAVSSDVIRRTVRRAAERIVGDLRRQVQALLPATMTVPADAAEELVRSWERDLLTQLRDLFIGEAVSTDSTEERVDGVMRSILTRVRQAASRARATTESVIGAARETVGAVTRRVVSVARGLLGQANQAVQQAVGITEYQWITKSDDRVRPGHVKLHGTIQKWSSPPITDAKGHRAHPGQERNCRCLAMPVVPVP
jgi:SPP1 gp7 family putative phage head morphogenesis protein